MKLSIIIPHYNQPELLEILLRSIGNESSTQIIVVDDHSDKDLFTLNQLMKNPAFGHVLFLEVPPHQKGPGCARNFGIEYATGQYLMMCDADDVLESNYQEFIQPYLESDFDLVVFKPTSRLLGTQNDAHRVDKYRRLIEDYLSHPCEKTEDALRFTFYMTPSKLYKREMIVSNQLRYDETMVSEDVMFTARVGATAKTIACSNEVIYCVTRSKHSLTMIRNRQTYDTRFKILLIQHAFIRAHLGERRYRRLDLPSMVFIVNAFTTHLGLKIAYESALTMRRNHIKIWGINQLKPHRLLSFLRLSKGIKQASLK